VTMRWLIYRDANADINSYVWHPVLTMTYYPTFYLELMHKSTRGAAVKGCASVIWHGHW